MAAPWSASPAPSEIPLDEVDTPALVVDLDALEGNIARMAKASRAARCGCVRTRRAKVRRDRAQQIAAGCRGRVPARR